MSDRTRFESSKVERPRFLWILLPNALGVAGVAVAAISAYAITDRAAVQLSKAKKDTNAELVRVSALRLEAKTLQKQNALLRKENEAQAKNFNVLQGQAENAISMALQTKPDSTICYVKYHNDPESLSLAKRASSVLLAAHWVAPVYVANYKGPGKKQGYSAQIRYSSETKKTAALSGARLLGSKGIPTCVQQVTEPKGQENYLRLWILH